MATKNIEININNGSSYDILYPKINLGNVTGNLPIGNTTGTIDINSRTTGNLDIGSRTTGNLPSSRLSGAIPVTNGGTGKTTLKEAMGNLCYSSPTITSLNDNYYFGCANSTTNGGGVKLSTLKDYITKGGSGEIQFKNGDYQGTGTATEQDKFSIQIGFAPHIFILYDNLEPFMATWGYYEVTAKNTNTTVDVNTHGFFMMNHEGELLDETIYVYQDNPNELNYRSRIYVQYVNGALEFTLSSLSSDYDSASESIRAEGFYNRGNRTYYWLAIKFGN